MSYMSNHRVSRLILLSQYWGILYRKFGGVNKSWFITLEAIRSLDPLVSVILQLLLWHYRTSCKRL